jgi:hypothetical protein
MNAREKSKNIEVEGRKFTITKYTAMDGLKIAKLLLAKVIPAFQDFLPLVKKMNSGGKIDAEESMASIVENLSLDTIADALDKVSEADFDYIVKKSLQCAEEKLKAGSQVVMYENGIYGIEDIEYDPLLVLRLTCEAVVFGCGGFFDVNRLTSVMKPLFSSLQPNPQI